MATSSALVIVHTCTCMVHSLCFCESQGGSHVEVFTAQGRDPLSRWKLTGSVNREYHKDVRGYVVTMEGGSSTINTQMKLPKTDKLLCKCRVGMTHLSAIILYTNVREFK